MFVIQSCIQMPVKYIRWSILQNSCRIKLVAPELIIPILFLFCFEAFSKTALSNEPTIYFGLKYTNFP